VPILIIDDNIELQEVMATVLEMKGYKVVFANNGIKGLAAIEAHCPSVVICDIDMPELDGDGVFKKLRAMGGEIAAIPFIFISGRIDEKDQISRLYGGADACFIKPVNLELLCAQVSSLLSTKSRNTALFQSKLEKIETALKISTQEKFHHYPPLFDDLDDYVHSICNVISLREITELKGSSKPDILEKDYLIYIQLWLQKVGERKFLLEGTSIDYLNWQIIYLAAEAEFQQKNIYVSDLYIMIEAARATINARLKTLVENNILSKSNDTEDRRRQLVTLQAPFQRKLEEHIRTSISQIRLVF